MKFYIHRTLNCENVDLLRSTYPILNSYAMHDEKVDWSKTMVACINIDSLDQLIELNKETKNPIIIDVDNEIPIIEIYDDWRE